MSFNLKSLRGTGAGIALSFVYACSQTAQGADLDESIRRLRMGTLVVEAPPGMEVRVEQVRHEFWFGAALASQMFGGRSGGEDASKYKQVFLDNFNAAVTENALKWHSMERRKARWTIASWMRFSRGRQSMRFRSVGTMSIGEFPTWFSLG